MGAGLIVTVTLTVCWQIPVLAVNVYTVVVEGPASGVKTLLLLNPSVGVQAKVLAFDTAASNTLLPSQIGAGAETLAVTVLLSVTTAVSFSRQPLASMMAAW